MNERELGAMKVAAESWVNIATGRPLEGLLEGCSVRVSIYDADGDVIFMRKRGPHFDALEAKWAAEDAAAEAARLDEPIPYVVTTPEFREEQKGTEPIDPFSPEALDAVRAENAKVFEPPVDPDWQALQGKLNESLVEAKSFIPADAVEAVTQPTPEMLAEALTQK